MGSTCSCFFPSSFPLSYSFVSPQKIATKDHDGAARLQAGAAGRGTAEATPLHCLKKRSGVSRGRVSPSETRSHEPNLARCRWLFQVWRGGGRS
ncbi:uncharacterized protein LY79DRAFT_595326 [Colletotrichum navitas]|uniref:Uncharacterized protein n=1 Tax=Colletotrichum navitas TaxID=681940 RepID=A0AAD8PJT0_9PEZI|nr:uncharacterized protein LY79DRAFT_595326 [Colletotrichum navitas]KAK1564140.1 hypothetical protein LY79DRAFT_595326 [Colletotrichum navitas]